MPPRDDGQDIDCTCKECMFSSIACTPAVSSIHVCYNQASVNYMKVRGDEFTCSDSEPE